MIIIFSKGFVQKWFLLNLELYVKLRPDNSTKDNSADLKFREFSQKYETIQPKIVTAAVAPTCCELANRG